MSEPSNITTNVAPIYSADLLYEQNCKCGTIEVLGEEGDWAAGTGDKVWRIDVLYCGDSENRPVQVFSALSATNISESGCTSIVGAKYVNGQTIMGDFTAVTAAAITGVTLILYKDCRQS